MLTAAPDCGLRTIGLSWWRPKPTDCATTPENISSLRAPASTSRTLWRQSPSDAIPARVNTCELFSHPYQYKDERFRQPSHVMLLCQQSRIYYIQLAISICHHHPRHHSSSSPRSSSWSSSMSLQTTSALSNSRPLCYLRNQSMMESFPSSTFSFSFVSSSFRAPVNLAPLSMGCDRDVSDTLSSRACAFGHCQTSPRAFYRNVHAWWLHLKMNT